MKTLVEVTAVFADATSHLQSFALPISFQSPLQPELHSAQNRAQITFKGEIPG